MRWDMPISGFEMDMPVSGFEMEKPMSLKEVNHALNERRVLGAFMDDTYIDPTERRFKILNDLIRDYTEMLQFHQVRKITSQKSKRCNQKIEDLGRHIYLISEIRRMKHKVRLLSAKTQLRTGRTRRKSKLIPPRHTRRLIKEASEDNLCQAVQGMQLNSENSFRKSGLMLFGNISLAKVDGPSEVAEDLSKLCMN